MEKRKSTRSKEKGEPHGHYVLSARSNLALYKVVCNKIALIEFQEWLPNGEDVPNRDAAFPAVEPFREHSSAPAGALCSPHCDYAVGWREARSKITDVWPRFRKLPTAVIAVRKAHVNFSGLP